MQSSNDEIIVTCSCSKLDHSLRFSRNDDENIMYVEMILDINPSFWGRLKTAFYFVFGHSCNYVTTSEVVLQQEQQEQLRKWLK